MLPSCKSSEALHCELIIQNFLLSQVSFMSHSQCSVSTHSNHTKSHQILINTGGAKAQSSISNSTGMQLFNAMLHSSLHTVFWGLRGDRRCCYQKRIGDRPETSGSCSGDPIFCGSGVSSIRGTIGTLCAAWWKLFCDDLRVSDCERLLCFFGLGATGFRGTVASPPLDGSCWGWFCELSLEDTSRSSTAKSSLSWTDPSRS